MWFTLSLAALLCWSFSDLFSKIGCRSADERLNPLKMTAMVGAVMGLHAAYELIFGGVSLTLSVLLTYLPVSLLYIGSMLIGYLGLRYIELSISSPVCNSSGALVAVLCLALGRAEGQSGWMLFAVALVTVGVVGLGITEMQEDDAVRAARQSRGNYRYTKSFLALALPVVYCLLDALGTFADGLVLERLDEASANAAYELTFFFVGAVCFFYVTAIKKERFSLRSDAPKLFGAIFETAGQFAYIYAIGDSEHLVFAAPMISAYCAVSVLWGRIVLREKLSVKHYAMVALVITGVVLLGALDG